MHLCVSLLLFCAPVAFAAPPAKFFEAHCNSCHDADTRSGGLDLTVLTFAPADPENFARWVLIHDRIAAGEMPPKNK
ncbi:MAG TPA: c-type cytochrome domain-containing protein, partial [Gemmata sp.]